MNQSSILETRKLQPSNSAASHLAADISQPQLYSSKVASGSLRVRLKKVRNSHAKSSPRNHLQDLIQQITHLFQSLYPHTLRLNKISTLLSKPKRTVSQALKILEQRRKVKISPNSLIQWTGKFSSQQSQSQQQLLQRPMNDGNLDETPKRDQSEEYEECQLNSQASSIEQTQSFPPNIGQSEMIELPDEVVIEQLGDIEQHIHPIFEWWPDSLNTFLDESETSEFRLEGYIEQ